MKLLALLVYKPEQKKLNVTILSDGNVDVAAMEWSCN